MNYSCSCMADTVRAMDYSGLCKDVTVVVRSTAGMTEPRMGTDTGFGVDTRFDMNRGSPELLSWW